jgi:hypothetical protein
MQLCLLLRDIRRAFERLHAPATATKGGVAPQQYTASQEPQLIRSPHSTMELKDNTIIVVLGASGDLAKKKTVSLE